MHLHHFRHGDRILTHEGERGNGAGLPTAEVLVHHGDGRVVVDITGEHHGHVVRHVVGVEVLLDLHHARVLQVLALADGGLRAVRMALVEGLVHGRVRIATVVVLPAVELLVHRFEFGVEQAQHEVLEALTLDHHPLLQFITGDVVHIDRALRAGEGVGSARADAGDHLRILVRDGDGSSQCGQAVDHVVDPGAFAFVGGLAAQFILVADGLDQHTLLRPVTGTELGGALEQHMLQVVRQAGRIGRIVLAARARGDVGLHAWRVGVAAQPHLQAIGQRVDPRLHRIAGHGCVSVGACATCRDGHAGRPGWIGRGNNGLR